ncbi:hypothetical protein [Streptosporangium vulgare]|uniref:hypothetical protein n=1 Tax=Streptosporangium vulgare TaxID=46190 RepID=UPI0031DA6537
MVSSECPKVDQAVEEGPKVLAVTQGEAESAQAWARSRRLDPVPNSDHRTANGAATGPSSR